MTKEQTLRLLSCGLNPSLLASPSVESWIRHCDNEPGERFLADFKLFKEVRQQVPERLVADTALDNIQVVARLLHDPQPRFVNCLEPLCLLHRHQLIYIITARRYASEVYAVVVCLSVRPSVCLSPAGSVPKQLNVGSRKQRHTIAMKR